MKFLKIIFFIIAVAYAGFQLVVSDEIKRPPGVLAPQDPLQAVLERAQSITFDDFLIEPKASYDIEARVLSVERYRMDRGAALAPIDFAVGWGPMSDTDTLKHFRVTQGARFYTIYPDEEAIDITTALRSSANMHLIPADGAIRQQLLSTKPGSIVHLQGYLVGVSRSDGFTWNSSLTREDSGDGACELMYVQSIERH